MAKKKKKISENKNVGELDFCVIDGNISGYSRVKKSNLLDLKTMTEKALNSTNVPDNWFDIENEDEESAVFPKNVIVTSKSNEKDNVENVTPEEYTNYTSDFWYLISKYIKPEQVGTFASLCKETNLVVSRKGFWNRLYARYYDPIAHDDLPERLLPECMLRPKGLRANVIKMLHMTYEPFLEKQGRVSLIWPDPHLLTGRVCLVNWSNKLATKSVFYYFKLKSTIMKKSTFQYAFADSGKQSKFATT